MSCEEFASWAGACDDLDAAFGEAGGFEEGCDGEGAEGGFSRRV